jgi:GT2 family glycosyltransferase/tetratricopeptide (TPR) repeat protein
LHLLLADLTDDLSHFQEAALARPDLQPTRAGLGCALARNNRLAEAIPHLRRAVADNPFDRQATRGLFEALGMTGDPEGQRRLARERRLLCRAAPQVAPPEDWFQQAPPVGDELASIIVLCCNQLEFTRQCLESLLERTRAPYELILVDNGSADGTEAYLKEIAQRTREPQGLKTNSSHAASSLCGPGRVEVIRNETNLGFAVGCNQALKNAHGRYIVFLNNDTIVTDHWLEGLIGWTLHDWPKVGLVGPVTNYSRFPQSIPVDYMDVSGVQEFAARRLRQFVGKAMLGERLTGFCALIRREVLDQIGGFDERFGLGFFEDDDLCVRVQEAGYQLLVALNVFIHHFGSKTFEHLGIDCRKQLAENLEKFKAKWGAERASCYRVPDDSKATEDSGRTARTPPISEPGPITACDSRFTTPKVSLCMIVKNEEDNLPGCLESVGDVFHEIVVVDTGSTDKTKEVAERYGAKVSDFPWVDSFSAARNESLRHATGNWTLWLDADDRLDADNREKLRALFARLNGEITGYSMKCLCLPDRHRGTSTAVDHLRLFPNHPKIRWEYRVHEQILPSIRRLGGNAMPVPISIHHTGYQVAAVRAQKHERDLRLLELDYHDNPKDPFTLFNLGWIKLETGHPAEAIPFLGESLKRSQPADSIVRKLFTLLVQCYRQLGQSREALETCESGRRFYPDDVELLFHESLVRRENGDRTGSEKCLLRILQSREGPHFASLDIGLATFKARHNLAVLYSEDGRTTEAEAQWRSAVKESPTYFPAWLGLVEMYLGQRRFAEAQRMTQQVENHYPDKPWGAILSARSLLAQQDFESASNILEQVGAKFPYELTIWLILGNALLATGKDLGRAEEVLRKIVELDPANSAARRNLTALEKTRSQRARELVTV